jgi:hypothetical protein
MNTPRTKSFFARNTSLMEKMAAMEALERELAEVIDQRDVLAVKLSELLVKATANRKAYFKRSITKPDDEENRNAYYYEEGRTRAYSDAICAMKGEMP